MRPSPINTLLLRGLQWLLAWLCLAGSAVAQPLQVDGRAAIEVWPAVTLLRDTQGQLTAAQVAAQPQRFSTPQGTPGNLGRTADVVWLRVPVQVPGSEARRHVLTIDYPALNHIDVYQLQGDRLSDPQRLGNQLHLAERAMSSRTHAATLTLPPGDSTLLLRVQTRSSMVLPITLRTPEGFADHESGTNLVLGLLAGLGLCMLAYSLMHWAGLRDAIFLDYAVLLASNLLFILTMFGVTGRYLWPDTPHWSMHASPLAVLTAIAAASRFMRSTLGMREISPLAEHLLRGIGLLAAASVALGLPGLLGYGVLQSLSIVLGLSTGLLVLPVAFVRARRGERVAAYILGGWAFYMLGAFTTAGLLRGYLEPGFWSLYLYAISTMIEMSAWMAVLSLRVQTIHRSADRARVETETLRTLAQTDALTGLPNRRGLQQHLAQALAQASPSKLLAVYLLDLDGFKPVNDRWGHDVGDALLVAVGQRLQAQLRGSDVVARLGGDEFVVLASGLADEATAHAVGQKLLAAVEQPFDAAGQLCEVGLTVGYALAPLDATSGEDLIKRADAAMYAGKQAGRRRVQRGGRSLAMA